jgi:hypothetical protein
MYTLKFIAMAPRWPVGVAGANHESIRGVCFWIKYSGAFVGRCGEQRLRQKKAEVSQIEPSIVLRVEVSN